MKKMPVLICICLLIPLQGRIRADERVVIPEGGLDPDRLKDPFGRLHLSGGWRYHPGDRAEWADPAFDDRSWILLDSSQMPLDPGVLSAIDWTGIGWFRLHLTVDPSLWDHPLSLLYHQMGAGEIYLDGRLIHSSGTVGDSREAEETYAIMADAAAEIIPVRFSRQREHVIAVRYSNFWAMDHLYLGTSTGFGLALSELGNAVEQRATVARDVTVHQVLSVVPLAFALLHLLLFLFHPKSRGNLHYAIFAGCISVLVFAPLHPGFLRDPDLLLLFHTIFKAAIILAPLFGIRFLHHIFLGASPRFFRIHLALSILMLLFALYIPISWVFVFFILALFPEMMRIVFVAVRDRKDGARIIGAGCAVFAVACTFQAVMEILAKGFPFIFFPYIYGVVVLVVSMSIYLARDFARTNRDLETQLVRGNELSANLEQANRQLEEYSRTLEQKVEERTREVNEKNAALEETLHELRNTQSQLVMREKMASLGNLVAGVAHEINNPVGAVGSASDVSSRCADRIEDVVESGETIDAVRGDRRFQQALRLLKDNTRIAIEGSERIAKIVKSLRNFARLDEAEFQNADLHEGLESTLTLLDHDLRDRISVVKEYGEIPRVYCSPGELNQVFMNLLTNAIEAIEGQGTIRIETLADEAHVYVKISDTGRGIPAEKMDTIFDPGVTDKGGAVGVGLGLPTSYRIVQRHKGTIEVESELGEGSTFAVKIPFE